ncbi:MAG: protein translocase subunit SecD [Deltaproteobacteria bacterium]|jgi:protein-export membrane protein SecD|nr:protein translocase subunit SecD [Deltaproteobacteria bacterium]
MLAAGWAPKLGLDLQGGFAVTLVAPDGTDPETLETAADIIRLRIENLGGVQEPEVAVVGDRAIVVQLPGVDDRERALQAVGTTGQLSFRPVLSQNVASPALTHLEAVQPEGNPTTDPILQPLNEVDSATGFSIVDVIEQRSILEERDTLFAYEVGGVDVVFQNGAVVTFPTGSDIVDATAQLSTGLGGGWVVVPEFTGEGGEKFREATAYLSTYPVGDPRRQMAIVVDGTVFSAPAIAADVSPGEGLDPNAVVITVGQGENSQQEAEDLAALLRYGALPTTFERERVESVSASLGEDSLRAGLIAGLVGLALVAVYLLIYYRALGLIAIVGLTVFGSYLVGAITLLGELNGTTLTLAGVTGVVVSIGITSDSYIVYFERIKEEFRAGRSVRSSVSRAFQSAFSTILKGDTVTLLAAVLLYALAVGQVKGFALTLGIATVVDVFIAYFYTRPAAFLMSRSGLGDGGRFSIRGAMDKVEQAPEPELEEVAS